MKVAGIQQGRCCCCVYVSVSATAGDALLHYNMVRNIKVWFFHSKLISR